MLQKDNLILRPFRSSDIKEFTVLANNKKIWDNIRNRMPHPYKESDAKVFFDRVTSPEVITVLGIEWNGQLVGATGLHPEDEGDVYAGTAELGYWIGEPFWGKGIATKAVELIIKYGFEQLGYRRIYAGTYAFNTGSMKVLEKNGFEKEGVFKKAVMKNGIIWDEHRFGLVK